MKAWWQGRDRREAIRLLKLARFCRNVARRAKKLAKAIDPEAKL